MELIERIRILEDKQAIQELTHSYLAAADRKNPAEMAAHFTSNGMLTSIMSNEIITMEDTNGIIEGFTNILVTIDTAYHMAGQLQITLDGDKAKGISYSFVTLVGNKNNQRYIHKIWASYQDEYQMENNRWLISKRVATIAWEEKNILN